MKFSKRLDVLLIGTAILITAVSTSVSGFNTIYTERKLLLNQIDSMGNALVSATSIFAIEPLLIQDYPVLDTYTNSIVHEDFNIISLKIFNKKGVVVSKSDLGISKETLYYTSPILPIPDLKENIGHVEIGISTDEYQKDIRRHIYILIMQMLLRFLVLTLAFFFLIRRRVGKPLIHLDNMITSFGEGDLDHKIYLQTKDELGHLAFNMELMRVKLKKMYQREKLINVELTDSNERYKALAKNLEKLVSDQVETIKKTQSQLYQSDKMASIGQLAAGVAHEINNPVGYVLSNSHILIEYIRDITAYINILTNENNIDTINSEKKRLDIEYILGDIDNLLSSNVEGLNKICIIVNNLKSFSHIDDHDIYKYSDINENILSTLNVVHNEIKYIAKVTTDFGEIPNVECNIRELNQVFLNLLINSIQSIKQKNNGEGLIFIKTYKKELNVICEFGDNGLGIPENIMNDIFNPFFTTKDIGVGTGLGLNIAYDIVVTKHKGIIDVKSEDKIGATFTLKLPIERSL